MRSQFSITGHCESVRYTRCPRFFVWTKRIINRFRENLHFCNKLLEKTRLNSKFCFNKWKEHYSEKILDAAIVDFRHVNIKAVCLHPVWTAGRERFCPRQGCMLTTCLIFEQMPPCPMTFTEIYWGTEWCCRSVQWMMLLWQPNFNGQVFQK